MWDLWWTKWHWDMFLSEYFVFSSHYRSTNTPYAFIHVSRTLYTQPVFYARLFYVFSLIAPYQFTPLLKLRPMVLALTLFGWFICVYISLFSYVNMIYDLRPLFQEHNCGINKTLYTGLFISPSGISELDCATTKTDTAERSISIGTESLQVFFWTRGLGVLPSSTARG